MRAMARSAVAVGLGVLALVLAATMLSVMFATRGAMSTNRQIIEVLHVVGAKEGFIAGEFQRHFLLLGLKGGAIGGGAAMVLFALAGMLSDWFKGSAGREPDAALFGNLSLGAGRLWRDDRPRGAGRGRDGGNLAPDRAPHPEGHGMSACAGSPAAVLRYDRRRDVTWRSRTRARRKPRRGVAALRWLRASRCSASWSARRRSVAASSGSSSTCRPRRSRSTATPTASWC